MRTYAVKVNDAKYEVESMSVGEAAKKAIRAYMEGRKATTPLRLEIDVAVQSKVRKIA